MNTVFDAMPVKILEELVRIEITIQETEQRALPGQADVQELRLRHDEIIASWKALADREGLEKLIAERQRQDMIAGVCDPLPGGIAALDLKSSFSHFTETSRYIRDPFTGLMHTDGIGHLADRANAHWLLSDIGAVSGHHLKVKEMPFQLWTLVVDEENKAVLTCRDDCNTPVIYEQNYEYTDFPVGTWKMYLIEGVLMLPSEY